MARPFPVCSVRLWRLCAKQFLSKSAKTGFDSKKPFALDILFVTMNRRKVGKWGKNGNRSS